MVRTRHSGEGGEDNSTNLSSIRSERCRADAKGSEYKDEHSPTLCRGSRYAYNLFDEEKVVESRLRPRTGPSRAYNYLDADSSDEGKSTLYRDSYRRRRHEPEPMHEIMSEPRLRYTRSHQIKTEMIEEGQKERAGRRLRRGMSAPLQERQEHSVTEDEEEEDEHIETNQRRSLRTRRQTHDTLNQSYLVSGLARERKNAEEHEDPSDMKDHEENDSDEAGEFGDMYSRVKRKRVQIKRNMYGVPMDDSDTEHEEKTRGRNINNNKKNTQEAEDEDDDEEEEDEDEHDSGRPTRSLRAKRKCDEPVVKHYSLREHKPRTVLYKAPENFSEKRIRRPDPSLFAASTPTKKNTGQTYHSPAQRRDIRKGSALHSDSSSTTSDSNDSSDEKKFKRRKSKSMAKARSRMMPMNFSSNALPSGVIKDRVKSGASLADVEPMNIDKSVTFNSIGGLGKHIRALKEMVVFPLLYDKVFQRFKVDPPRGVLFYGPPGTGKTLVARALANECSHGDKKVAFFMRKGADCLSKWVGESERQLRLLFDQAYKFRPSIIFFDEIDGLAPVRSSRQDQIHSSIVSTLLALMDGLDSRGEIVVIGATNRIDSLDPALRRPGRFDREFLFPLPSLEARKQILKIQTASWAPKLNDNFISELAEKCVGYCGADLKALCTEAAMLALRRRYPQIYISNEALQLDETSINVSAKDFFDGVNNIIPTSQRAVNTPARALSARVCPLLERQLDRVMTQLSDTFPACLAQISSLDAAATSSQAMTLAENGAIWDEMASDEEEGAPSIFVTPSSSKGVKSVRKALDEGTSSSATVPTYLNFTSYATSRPATFRPRLMLVGTEGQGQTTYIAPAVVHKMESLPVHVLDLPALYAVTAKTPEESCANVFHEAKRKVPSIIYLPYINQWWDVMGETLRATLLSLIHNLDPTLPLLLLATSEHPYHTMDPMLQMLFSKHSGEVVAMTNPNSQERKAFFQDLLTRQACRHPPQKKQADEIIKLLGTSKKAKSRRRCIFTQRRRKINQSIPNFVYPFGKATTPKKKSSQRSKIVKSKKMLNDKPCSRVKQTPFLSKHNMKLRSQLRSRYLTIKFNTNQSARSFGRLCDNVVFTSVKPNFHSRSRNELRGKLHACEMSRPSTSSSSSTFRKALSVSDRHARYVRRLVKLEAKLAEVGSCHTAECFNPQFRDSHCSLANRHCRYVRRLRRLERTNLKRLTSRQNLEPLSKYLDTGSARCHCNQLLLTCGSSRMLYRDWEDPHSVKSYNALPLNIKDLLETSRFKLPARPSQQRAHSSRVCRRKHVRETRVFNRNARYNLRLTSPSDAQRMLEVLPKAAASKPKELSKDELKQLKEKEELTLMELRIFLRDVLNKLGSDKKFSIFAKPVDPEDAPDYYEIIEQPMDLSTMMSKIDLHNYATVSAFMKDIDLICHNALEYNPNRGPTDRIIRHRACYFKDTAYAIIKTELDKDFEKMCVEIEESRKRRGEKSSVPNFYYKGPITQQGSSHSRPGIPSYLEMPKPVRNIPQPEGERFSRRVRGITIEPTPPLETVEKVFRSNNSPSKDNRSPTRGLSDPNTVHGIRDNSSKPSVVISSSQDSHTKPILSFGERMKSLAEKNRSRSQSAGGSSSLSSKKSAKNKCVWCKPRRKKRRLVIAGHHRSRPDRDSMGENTEENMSQKEEEEEEMVTDSKDSAAMAQQLSIDVSELTCDTREVKSPSMRSSVRLRSPAAATAGGVVTRRSSMSPRSVSSMAVSGGAPGTSTATSGTAPSTADMEVDKTDGQSAPDLEPPKITAQELLSSSQNTILEEDRDTSSMPPVLSLSQESGKPSVIKRLDLDNVTVDSGVGSSVDSNGDSRDSLEHSAKEGATSSSVDTKDTNDLNQNCSIQLKSKASAILNESPQTLQVDTDRLAMLLTRVVAQTEGFTVERLEKLYSHLSQVIYRHRAEYNRTAMIVNLEKKVEELTRCLPSTSSSLGHSSGAFC